MSLALVRNFSNFLHAFDFSAPRFHLWVLCIVSIQLPAQSLKQELNNFPIIEINIASMDFPPNAHRTKSGRVSGKAIETIRALCTIAHMKCEVIIYPSARAYMGIENGTSDVLLTADIASFKRCCTYAEWSYPFMAGLITQLEIEDIPVNETMLQGHSLVMVRGWQSIYEVYPNLKGLVAAGKVELIETSSIASAIKIYSSGRTSLLWGSNMFEWYFEQLSMQWQPQDFKPLMLSSAGIWVSKQNNHHKEILYRFNLAYQLLREQKNLGKDNFLVPSLMKQVYIEASTSN
jgi:hypothetical protein